MFDMKIVNLAKKNQHSCDYNIYKIRDTFCIRSTCQLQTILNHMKKVDLKNLYY